MAKGSKTILYTVAKNKQGHLVRADEAEKGNDFYCPVCNSELLLRKSGNTSKNSKRPHFAHKTLTPNCTPETALHFSFKTLFAQKLQECINHSLELTIKWRCKYCGGTHTGNLIKKINNVKVENNLGICQPDITLFDSNEKVFAVIEVVVSHAPEPQVVEYYNSNDIILLQYNLASDNDLYEIDNKASNPDFVSICYNPKCKKCGNYLQKKIMTIIDGPCWKCDSNMKVTTISSGNGGDVRGEGTNLRPSDFTTEEIDFARSKGVILKQHYSKTAGDKYLSNTCGKCGAFAGDFYLFSQYIAPAGYGQLPSESFEIGYHCEHCENPYEYDV